MKRSFEQKDGGLYIRTDADGAALLGLLIRGAAGVALRLAGYDAGQARRIAQALGPQIERAAASGLPTVDFTFERPE